MSASNNLEARANAVVEDLAQDVKNVLSDTELASKEEVRNLKQRVHSILTVMRAWAREQKTGGKVRMLADGSADFAKATGLTLDLTARGMGLRSNRYSMLVKDGKVASLNVEAPGKFEVSDAGTLLKQAKG